MGNYMLNSSGEKHIHTPIYKHISLSNKSSMISPQYRENLAQLHPLPH